MQKYKVQFFVVKSGQILQFLSRQRLQVVSVSLQPILVQVLAQFKHGFEVTPDGYCPIAHVDKQVPSLRQTLQSPLQEVFTSEPKFTPKSTTNE